MASAGRILIMPKGNYDSSETYNMLDMVSHNGKTWLAKKTVSNIEPNTNNSEYWHDLITITPENIDAVQRNIWIFTSTANDSLLGYIKSKITEGYTSGVIQVNATGGVADVPNELLTSEIGTYFLCVFQKHHYDYVRVTLCADGSLFEYSNIAVLTGNVTWSGEWTQRLHPSGYLPKSGGTLTGDIDVKKDNASFVASLDDKHWTRLQKDANSNIDKGTTLVDQTDNTTTTLSIKNGVLQLIKQVDGVQVGSKIIAEIT